MIVEDYSKKPLVQRKRQVEKLGLYTFFRPISESTGRTVTVRGKKQVMVGSNNYLGLTHHPYVKEKAKEAIDKYGTGCTGSRFINGNLDLHEELEERLAKFMGVEKTIVYSTGMQTNLGSIAAITEGKAAIFSDAENHASIIDACRLSRSPIYKFKHNSMEELEMLLEENRDKYDDAMIIVDGVYSMTGDIANLPEIVTLSKKYNCKVYVDDAHGLGVLGPNGQGTPTHFGLQKDVDFLMGTFSKSFASIGGVLGGAKDSIEFVQLTSRSLTFSASIPPSAAATVLACLDILEKDDSLVKKLNDNVDFMARGFKDLGFYTYDSKTPIISILVGDELIGLQVAKALDDMGVFTSCILPPAVPKGEALIRTSYMASHEKEELQYVLDVFAKLKKMFPFATELKQGL
ncbi:MAG: aminotransferase class I/II-fold pyridoxal phosphate-dependent enzyme [Bacteriovoracaceae bacterium]|nr:aminotransferase class I/II-fold pyridoxal phosphate-dependent enzyme [Bacteriovoracaceae bacterium]